MTVENLNDMIFLAKRILRESKTEDRYQVKVTLGADVLGELEQETLCYIDKAKWYLGCPFERGGSTEVRIVEMPKLRYRPFKNCDELMAHWQKMVGYPAKPNTMPLIWVKCKISENVGCLTGFQKIAVLVCADDWRDMTEMFDDFTFLDGTPFGVAK